MPLIACRSDRCARAWWALTGSNRRPSRCKREKERETAVLRTNKAGMRRERVTNKRASADHLRTIPRKREPTPGAWTGIKPSENLMALYCDEGILQLVFDSSIELDLEIPEGDGPICLDDLRPKAGEPLQSDSPGVTYFIGGDVGAIKIGRSTSLAVRLKDIQACSPIPMRVLATRKGVDREKMYHRRFAEYRLHGEWFERTADIEAEIARLNA